MIVPETPAGMSVKTFMASMMQTVVSGANDRADRDEGRCVGGAGGVVGADHRALDHDRLGGSGNRRRYRFRPGLTR